MFIHLFFLTLGTYARGIAAAANDENFLTDIRLINHNYFSLLSRSLLENLAGNFYLLELRH